MSFFDCIRLDTFIFFAVFFVHSFRSADLSADDADMIQKTMNLLPGLLLVLKPMYVCLTYLESDHVLLSEVSFF
jgi:hypothetical protein